MRDLTYNSGIERDVGSHGECVVAGMRTVMAASPRPGIPCELWGTVHTPATHRATATSLE